jgi:hypothetical protein
MAWFRLGTVLDALTPSGLLRFAARRSLVVRVLFKLPGGGVGVISDRIWRMDERQLATLRRNAERVLVQGPVERQAEALGMLDAIAAEQARRAQDEWAMGMPAAAGR